MTRSAPQLMVVGFDDPDRAAEFLSALVRLQRQARLRLHDAVLVERDAAGRPRVRRTQDLTAGHGALGGALWGLLIGYLVAGPAGALAGAPVAAAGGALLGGLADTGVRRGTIRALCEELPPATAAVAVRLSRVSPDDLSRELSRHPGARPIESGRGDPARRKSG